MCVIEGRTFQTESSASAETPKQRVPGELKGWKEARRAGAGLCGEGGGR